MNLTRFAIRNQAIVLAVVGLLVLAGINRFLTMSRREDPEITIRSCIVTTQWAGATAAKVEELVTDPIEEVVDQIDIVKRVTSTTRTGLSIITVELEDTVGDAEIDQAWDEVRNKINGISSRLPEGCATPNVNSDFGDVASVIYALHQTHGDGGRRYSYRELELLAETIQDDLKTLESVAEVEVVGEQDEVIYIDVDAEWAKVGLTIDDLRQRLQARNITAPGGQIDAGPVRFTVQPTGEFTAVDQISQMLVARRDSELPVLLSDLPISGPKRGVTAGQPPSVQIRRDYRDPPREVFAIATPEGRAERTLLLSVTMKSGRNIVEMGEAIERRLADLRAQRLPPDVELVRINDLPGQVDRLVADFVTNLWQAIVIVLGVALLMMGWRAAVVMATAVPLCMIVSVLLVSMMGVELEQFSIASLIIALGMLVDNAIVVSDNVLREMTEDPDGDRPEAVTRGASGLAIPVLTSTATTVGAFVPMLTIIGNVGEYTMSLPIVVATTLIVSYLVAMMVTPIMCLWLLRPTRQTSQSMTARLFGALFRRKAPKSVPKPAPKQAAESVEAPSGYQRLVRWCLRHRTVTLGAAALAVVAAIGLVPMIGSQFFPGGVRDQLFIHVWLPEGSSIQATRTACERVEKILRETSRTEIDGESVERLREVTSFVGTGGPRLNLTTNPQQTFPNYGFMLVNTTDAELSRDWAREIDLQTRGIAGARVDVVPFMLGPYIENPVEFRLYGPDADVLREAAEKMLGVFRSTSGTVNPFSNWYNYGYSVEVEVDDEAANLAGVTNRSVADTMATLISGGRLTTYREGDHQVDVMLRIRPEQRAALLEDPGLIYVDGSAGKVPLDSIANVEAAWRPAVIARRENMRCITVGSKVMPGYLSNAIAGDMRPKLEEILEALPPGYRLEEGGEQEQTVESQEKLSGAFVLSFFLILLVLIAQYNSFLKPIVILSAVPLALIGALVGLFVTGWPLGFMPSLGIISLAGVVINNAIILIDFIESKVRDGAELVDAVAAAGQQRMKPILLTTATTVGGLLPLALFGGPMWAGMSWAMIFGLLLSTGLTLLVVPTIYVTFVRVLKMRVAT